MAERAYCVDLGRLEYLAALDLQHKIVAARQAGRIPDVLLLVEHDPVITVGRRGRREHILASAELLAMVGIAVHTVERGGDVTYHGPGQLVGYPILRLQDYRLGAADYMHKLEDVLLAVLADMGLAGHRREGIIGVWIGPDKVAALGARIERGVSYHGFALNVSTDLRHFGFIVPCGITDGGVTSLEQATGKPVIWGTVLERVCHHFAELFHVELERISRERLAQLLS